MSETSILVVVLSDEAGANARDSQTMDAIRKALPPGCVLRIDRVTGADVCASCAQRASCAVRPAVAALSRREREVALHIAQGRSSKQIAAALGIGLRTVNTYREALARKLGASSAAVVTRYVMEHGITA